MITTMRDEIYISIRVVSDQDLRRTDVQELIELLVLFFRLIVGALLSANDVLAATGDVAANLVEVARLTGRDLQIARADLAWYAWLAWQILVIVVRSLAYGLGVIA